MNKTRVYSSHCILACLYAASSSPEDEARTTI